MKIKIAFAHHLSLSYYGGGEKWIIQLAKELTSRGHEVEIYALPLLLDGKPKVNPKNLLDGIPYHEGYKHKINADVTYVTYHPLSHLTFRTSRPRIAGIHSHAYWLKPHPKYGLLPNLANITNKFTSYFELRGFNAIHAVSKTYPINHKKVFHIPNFVDSNIYKPTCQKSEDFTIAFASRKVWQKGWDVFQGIQQYFDGKVKVRVSGGISENKMPKFFSKSHLTIVPSRVDTFGLSIVESMMTETPVITTPLLTHKSLGLPAVYANYPEEFIEKIYALENMWQNRKEYNELSRLCRTSALRFDKKRIIDELENMFKEVVRNS